LVLAPCLAALIGVGAAIAFLPSLMPETTPPLDRTVPVRTTHSERTAVVATDVLNVRASASVDSAILASFANGQPVTVVGDPINGFLPVAYGTGRAWMAAEYLAMDAESLADGWRSEALVEDAGVAASEEPEVADAEPDVTAPNPGDEPAPASEDVWTSDERWIEVDRDTATVFLHEGNAIVGTFHGKIGRDLTDDGYYATALGTFHVYSMSKELAETPFAEDGYLTDWVGFDPERNNGFHSPVRDASGVEKAVQNPTTLGCVRLDAAAAEQVFAFAHVGMRVEIHE